MGFFPAPNKENKVLGINDLIASQQRVLAMWATPKIAAAVATRADVYDAQDSYDAVITVASELMGVPLDDDNYNQSINEMLRVSRELRPQDPRSTANERWDWRVNPVAFGQETLQWWNRSPGRWVGNDAPILSSPYVKNATAWFMMANDAGVDQVSDRIMRSAGQANERNGRVGWSNLDEWMGTFVDEYGGSLFNDEGKATFLPGIFPDVAQDKTDTIGNKPFFGAIAEAFNGRPVNIYGEEPGYIANSRINEATMQDMDLVEAELSQYASDEYDEYDADPQAYAENNLYATPYSQSDYVTSTRRKTRFDESIERNAEAQAQYGKPITESSNLKSEAFGISIPDDAAVLPWARGNQGTWSKVSVGRVGATMVTEQGTAPYQYLSGGIDFGKQIFADPMDVLGGSTAKGIKAAHAVGLTADAQKAVRKTAQVADDLGTLKGALRAEGAAKAAGESVGDVAKASDEAFLRIEELSEGADDLAKLMEMPAKKASILLDQRARKTIQAGEANRWITGRGAQAWVSALSEARTVEQIESILSKSKGLVDAKLVGDLSRAADEAEVIRLLMPKIENTGFSTGAIQRSARSAARRPSMDTYGVRDLFRIGADESLFRMVEASTEAIVDRLYQVQQRGVKALVGGGERVPLPVSSLGFRPSLRSEFGHTFLGRMVDNKPNMSIDLKNPNKGFQRLRRSLRSYGVDSDMVIGRTDKGRIIKGRKGDILGDQLDEGENFIAIHDIDNGLYKFTQMAPGHSEAGFRAVREVWDGVALKLLDDGIPAPYVQAITSLIEEQGLLSKFNTNAIGEVARYPGSSFKSILNGNVVDMPGHQLIAEMWGGSINIPNASIVRKTLAEKPNQMIRSLTGLDIGTRRGLNYLTTQKIRPITLTGVTGEALKVRETMNLKRWVGKGKGKGDVNKFTWARRGDLHQRASLAYAEAFMSNVWKPMKLLKFGYIPKVILGDEQGRITAAGLSSMWAPTRTGKGDSLLAYWAYLFGRKGNVDITGNRIADALEFKEIVSLKPNAYGEMGGIKSEHWISMPQGDPRYFDGLATEWAQLAADPIARKLLDPNFGDNSLEGVKDWLMNDPSGRAYLTQLTNNMGSEPAGVVPAIRFRDGDKWLDTYLEGVNARIQLKTGGDYIWVDPNTGIVHNSSDIGIGQQGVGDFANTKDGITITRAGDREVLEGLANGKMGDISLSDMNDGSYTRLRQYAEKRVRMQAENGVEYPQNVKYASDDYASVNDPKLIQRTSRKLMRGLLSLPAEKLNRAPVFKQFYWDAIAERIPLMTDEAAAEVWRLADEANVTSRVKVVSEEAGREYRKLGGGADGTLDDIEQIDLYAKAFAGEATQDLLFDFAERKNMFDAIGIMAPFADAWLELFTSWGRLFAQNPAMVRRPLKGYSELQDTDPTTWGEEEFSSNDGFFYENAYGEEVFAIPMGQEMANAIGKLPGISEDLPNMDFEVNAKGLNMIATSFFPPAGPVLTIPASFLIPKTPEYKWIRETVAPFGVENTLGEALMSETLQASPIANRFINAFTKGKFFSGEDERIFNNTVGWMLNDMIASGEYGVEDLKDGDRNIAMKAEAERRAADVYFVRGIIQSASPAAPGAPRFFLEDIEISELVGNDDEFTALALQDASSAYWNIKKGDGTEEQLTDQEATKVFTDKYGYDPLIMLVSLNKDRWKRANTEAGFDFELENPKWFEQLPATAYYLRPDDPDDPFYYDAYSSQINKGNKKPKPWNERVTEYEFRMGRIEYQRYEELIGEVLSDPGLIQNLADNDMTVKTLRESLLSEKKQEIKQSFPGYQQLEGAYSVADRQKELEELRQWSTITDIAVLPVAKSVETFFEKWDDMYALQLELGAGKSVSQSMPFQKSSSKQFTSSGNASKSWATRNYINTILLEEGEALAVSDPTFRAVWEGVFKSKIYDYSQDIENELNEQELTEQRIKEDTLVLMGG